MKITIADGKYTVVTPENPGERLHALRYGEPWRDCVGDNLVHALAVELQESRDAQQDLIAQIAVMLAVFEVEGEWDDNEPSCMKCGDMMDLNDGCEWSEDKRLNICNECAQEQAQKLLLLLTNSPQAANDLLERMEKMRVALDKWQPIETAPKDGSLIMLSVPKNQYHGMGWFEFTNGKWCIGEGFECSPTHWMPIPPHPPTNQPA